MEAEGSVRDTLNLLDNDKNIPGVLVIDHGELVGLLPRERVFEKIGRPFGVELFFKLNNEQFYRNLDIITLVVGHETLISEAVNLALNRNKQSIYDPFVIARPEGFAIATMYSLLMTQQTILKNLYVDVHQLSIKDPLTLINNRRGFFEAVQSQLEIHRQLDLEYAFLMIDIDNFKYVNDRYGHLVGDEVIKGIASLLQQKVRENDLIGRFGGEEFIVFLIDIAKDEALNLAERLRFEIANTHQKVHLYQIRVTVSIGVSHSKGAAKTIDRLLTEADFALYEAKNFGRNKILPWEGNMILGPGMQTNFREKSWSAVKQPQKLLDQTLNGFLRMLYLRDCETEAHTLRVAEMALSLAKEVGFSEERYDEVYQGALFHDIGKIAIPDTILFKPGKLTEAEWVIMRKHPDHAYDLLSSISYLNHLADIPYCHHERWDGSGYPRGLSRQEIPLSARIFSVVDVWDALSSDRSYRPAWKEDAVIAYIKEQAGNQFDPEIAPLFLECLHNQR